MITLVIVKYCHYFLVQEWAIEISNISQIVSQTHSLPGRQWNGNDFLATYFLLKWTDTPKELSQILITVIVNYHSYHL